MSDNKIQMTYREKLKKWADHCYAEDGDSQLIADCDKWCQQLADEPHSLENLLQDSYFVSTMRDACDYWYSKHKSN